MAAAGGERGRTSFQRRPGAGPRPPALPGTRPSVRHGQLLLSSGLPSLDCVLGGGVAVGTLLLIEEDKYGLYSNLLFKYFLAEGIVCGHDLFVASAKEHPDNILKEDLELIIVLEDKPASPGALHLTCGTLASAGSVTFPRGTCKPEAEEWELQNCFLQLSAHLFWKTLIVAFQWNVCFQVGILLQDTSAVS